MVDEDEYFSPKDNKKYHNKVKTFCDRLVRPSNDNAELSRSRILSWVEEAALQALNSSNSTRKRQVSSSVSSQHDSKSNCDNSCSELFKTKRLRKNKGKISSTDNSDASQVTESIKSNTINTRSRTKLSAGCSVETQSQNVRVTRASKKKLQLQNKQITSDSNDNASNKDNKHCHQKECDFERNDFSNKENCVCKSILGDDKSARIKLSGQSICGGSIILEVTISSKGWKVNCIGPDNTIIKCNRKPGYQIANFDICVDSANVISKGKILVKNKECDETNMNIDKFYRNKKCKSNKVKDIINPMVIIESDQESGKDISKDQMPIKCEDYGKTIINIDKFYRDSKCLEIRNVANSMIIETDQEKNEIKHVKNMLNELENTKILNTLFSSNETLIQDTQEDPVKLRIKTIDEINDAIDTIVINDDESENCFSQSGAVKQIIENKKITKKKKVCPEFKFIKGTPFAVDAFNFGDLGSRGVEYYFLTHFHSDHYIGLNKKFCRPLYCSQITANLLDLRIKVNKKFINVLELNKPTIINDVEVTALDANHCPGSIMLLFKVSGKCILHTGDFRAHYDMELYPSLQNIQVDRLYLDTTYCKKQYCFPAQQEAIDIATNLVKVFLMKNPTKRTLVVVGSYLIGKEKMWLGLSKTLSRKVWIEKSRYDLIKAFENDLMYLENVVEEPNEADIHVLPVMELNTEKMSKYLEKFNNIFDHIFAIRPSGWEQKKKPYTIGNVTIAGVAYSEHSSYEELKRFVSFLKPKKIIATAGNEKELRHLYKDCKLEDPNLNTIDKYFKQTSF